MQVGRRVRILARALAIAGVALTQSSCFLTLLFLTGSINSETGNGSATVGFSIDECLAEPNYEPPGCSSFCSFGFGGTTALATPQTSEYDFLGVDCDILDLFLDPLIVQLPNSVSGLSGTFTGMNPASMGSLVIQSGLSCVDTLPGEQICAEAGHQLAILSLPDSVTEGDISATLNFNVNPPAAIQLKAISAGRIIVNSETFYPILFPCVTSFASVSSFTIPLGMPAQVAIPTSGEPCNRQVALLQVTPEVAAPAMSMWALLLLVGLAGGIGLWRESRRV